MSSVTFGPHGLLLIDKSGGMTSHDVVAKARRALGTRKIGHAGTLDPMAKGLMVLGVGDATRLLTYIVGDDKVYEAEVCLGIGTNTEDADGQVTEIAPVAQVRAISFAALEDSLRSFTGELMQVPSAVSAIKVNGVRSYQRVRDGAQVELAARPVTIHELELLSSTFQQDERAATLLVRMRVRCSSGTYVRALGRDIGASLGVPAHLTALRRLRVGPYNVADAVDVGVDDLAAHLIPLADAATSRFPSFVADEGQTRALRHGQRIPAPDGTAQVDGPIAALTSAGDLIGLIEIRDGKTATLMNVPERTA